MCEEQILEWNMDSSINHHHRDGHEADNNNSTWVKISALPRYFRRCSKNNRKWAKICWLGMKKFIFRKMVWVEMSLCSLKSSPEKQVQHSRMNLKNEIKFLCIFLSNEKIQERNKKTPAKIGALTSCERAEQKTLIELFRSTRKSLR